jgi:hypothetical protein
MTCLENIHLVTRAEEEWIDGTGWQDTTLCSETEKALTDGSSIDLSSLQGCYKGPRTPAKLRHSARCQHKGARFQEPSNTSIQPITRITRKQLIALACSPHSAAISISCVDPLYINHSNLRFPLRLSVLGPHAPPVSRDTPKSGPKIKPLIAFFNSQHT